MNPKDLQNLKPEPKSLGEWLSNARIRLNSIPDEPISSLYALAAHVLKQPAHFGISHPEHTLTSEGIERLDDLLTRLIDGTPLPYLTGKQEFYGLEFDVTPDVLIPRPETELLVELAIQWLESHPTNGFALDVGTGSGCIAVSICANVPHIRCIGIDRSYDALQVARGNVRKHHLDDRILLAQTDLLEGIAGGFDCICANLPYIPTSRLPELPVSRQEPLLALDGGEKGLATIEKFLRLSTGRISPGGAIFLEIDYSQANFLTALAEKYFPNSLVEIENDLAGLPRVATIHPSHKDR